MQQMDEALSAVAQVHATSWNDTSLKYVNMVAVWLGCLGGTYVCICMCVCVCVCVTARACMCRVVRLLIFRSEMDGGSNQWINGRYVDVASVSCVHACVCHAQKCQMRGSGVCVRVRLQLVCVCVCVCVSCQLRLAGALTTHPPLSLSLSFSLSLSLSFSLSLSASSKLMHSWSLPAVRPWKRLLRFSRYACVTHSSVWPSTLLMNCSIVLALPRNMRKQTSFVPVGNSVACAPSTNPKSATFKVAAVLFVWLVWVCCDSGCAWLHFG